MNETNVALEHFRALLDDRIPYGLDDVWMTDVQEVGNNNEYYAPILLGVAEDDYNRILRHSGLMTTDGRKKTVNTWMKSLSYQIKTHDFNLTINGKSTMVKFYRFLGRQFIDGAVIDYTSKLQDLNEPFTDIALNSISTYMGKLIENGLQRERRIRTPELLAFLREKDHELLIVEEEEVEHRIHQENEADINNEPGELEKLFFESDGSVQAEIVKKWIALNVNNEGINCRSERFSINNKRHKPMIFWRFPTLEAHTGIARPKEYNHTP